MSSIICTAWGNSLLSTYFSPSVTLYVALFSASPGLGASIANEIAGGSYARQATTFSTPSSKTSSNNSILSFPNMPACSITHIGLCTTLTGSTLFTFADIPGAPVSVPNSAEVRYEVGDYAVSF